MDGGGDVVLFPVRASVLAFLDTAKTGFVSHPASHTVGKGKQFSEGKVAGARWSRNYTPTPMCLYNISRDKFTPALLKGRRKIKV